MAVVWIRSMMRTSMFAGSALILAGLGSSFSACTGSTEEGERTLAQGPAPVAPAPVTGDAPAVDAATEASAPLPVPSPAPTRFVLLGDFGFDDQNEAAVAELVRAWKPEFVVTLGDNSYPKGTPETIDETIGKYYSEYIFPYRGRYGKGANEPRFFACLGNHDWDSGDVSAHQAYFDLPGNERYWDIGRGPVRIYCVDSDTREPDGTTATSVQGQWLERQLKGATAPFRVVVFHHPAHSSGYHGSQPYMQWPFEAWGASAVYTGHDHDYERFDFGTGSIPYVVQGTGGADLRGMNSSRPGSVIAYSEKHGATFVTANDSYAVFAATTVGRERIDEHVVIAPTELARESVSLLPPGSPLHVAAGTPPLGWPRPNLTSPEWRVGAAPIGYGGGERTTVERRITHYVASDFVLPRGPFDHLVVWLRRDDGAAIFINGREVGRSNLSEGALGPDTMAVETIGFEAERAWTPIVVPATFVSEGRNLLAIELHQASATSSDAYLDVRVEAKR